MKKASSLKHLRSHVQAAIKRVRAMQKETRDASSRNHRLMAVEDHLLTARRVLRRAR